MGVIRSMIASTGERQHFSTTTKCDNLPVKADLRNLLDQFQGPIEDLGDVVAVRLDDLCHALGCGRCWPGFGAATDWNRPVERRGGAAGQTKSPLSGARPARLSAARCPGSRGGAPASGAGLRRPGRPCGAVRCSRPASTRCPRTRLLDTLALLRQRPFFVSGAFIGSFSRDQSECWTRSRGGLLLPSL